MIYGTLAVGLFVIGFGFLMGRSYLIKNRVAKNRKSDSIQTFLQEFGDDSMNRSAIEMAYLDLVKLVKMPVHRTDDLSRTLGLLPEDFDKAVQTRCRQLGVPDIWHSSYATMFPLKTVEDYVRLLSSICGARLQ